MKSMLLSGLAALPMLLAMTPQGQAQTPSRPIPTTRILAIGTFDPGVDLAVVRAILPKEVVETVKLYLDGKIDQWFSLADRSGVVFLLNVTDIREASEMLESLPLGRAHLMHFELMPLGPLGPLRQLPGMAHNSP